MTDDRGDILSYKRKKVTHMTVDTTEPPPNIICSIMSEISPTMDTIYFAAILNETIVDDSVESIMSIQNMDRKPAMTPRDLANKWNKTKIR